jgi:hypothetical protein
VQVSVWLRLRLLLPLLPTVRADREPDSKKNLRVCLAQTLPHLLVSPYVRGEAAAATASGDAAAAVGADDLPLAAAAAAAEAGHSLFDRLLLMLSALLSGEWAGWLRGANRKLRQVAVPAALAAACRAEIEGALQVQSAADDGWQQQQQQMLLTISPGTPLTAGIAAAAVGGCASLDGLHAVEALVHALWQQQQQQILCTEQQQQQQQQRKLPLQGLASRYKQRALAALPLPGTQFLQLPSMLVAPLQQHAGNSKEPAAAGLMMCQQRQQQQQAVPYSWDVWQPVFPLRHDAVAVLAASQGAAGGAVGSRPAAAAAAQGAGNSSSQPAGIMSPGKRQLQQQQQGPGSMARTSDGGSGVAAAACGVRGGDAGSGAAGDAAACLLKGCVRRRRQALLYAGHGADGE